MIVSQGKGKPECKSDDNDNSVAGESEHYTGKENMRPKEQNSSVSSAPTIRFVSQQVCHSTI